MTVSAELNLSNFLATVPAMAGGNSAFAARYARELREVVVRQAHRQPRNVQRHLGPSELGHICLSGDTEVVTRTGIRKIADLAAEGSAELLVPMLYEGSDIRKRWGKFRHVPVSCYGEDELFEVTLRRGFDRKIVHATADHHWFRSYWSGKVKKQEMLTTASLKKGHKLAQLRRAMPRATTMMPVAVAQGFVFGDGTHGSSDSKHRPAVLNLFHNGKDEALLPFFPGEHAVYKDPGYTHERSYVQCLPRFWKKLPPAEESVSFLMSWLAGYFAADGSVSEDGHCTINSASRDHLEFVREAAAICGVGYGQIHQYMRQGISGKDPQPKKTAIYRISLRHHDLPTWFFIIEEHLRRVKALNTADRDLHWVVESVEPTGRTEPVYCATVDGIGAFGLADDLMTGNCHRLVIGKFAGEQITNHVTDPWPSIVGTAVHAWLAEKFLIENTINGVIRWVTEQRVHPDPLYPGTADLYDAYEQVLVDHKGGYIHTPIATPDGWTTLGQLQPGNTVFGADGQPCQVTRVYPVQHRDCYRITFDDGSDLITDDVQELPFVRSRPKPQPALMSTAEAAGKVWRQGSWPQRQLRLYNSDALELPPADLLVHPYVLGCWLGDGSVHAGTISKPDDELYENIRACGYEVSAPHGQRQLVRTVYGLSGQLRVLGLQWPDPDHPESHGRLAGVKQVPPEYLRGSYEQRLALLQGLMDTDGSWNRPRKRAVFTTTSKHLAEVTAELVTTLGWKACISPQQTHGFGLTVTAYHVEFTPSGANPFRLSRKANLVRLEGSRVSGYRIVKSIEPVLSVPTRCIDVDSPDHLYLAGEQMLPVHNCLGPTSMAKVQSAEGPPWHYIVQLLLYAHGYRKLGLPVRRVVLAAWPRTGSSLDSMYCWERPYEPARDDAIVASTLQLTAARRRVAQAVMAGQLRIEQVPRTPGDECYFCPFYRPQSARDGGPGCPGQSAPAPAPGALQVVPARW